MQSFFVVHAVGVEQLLQLLLAGPGPRHFPVADRTAVNAQMLGHLLLIDAGLLPELAEEARKPQLSSVRHVRPYLFHPFE